MALLLDSLNRRLSPYLETKLFELLFNATVFLNPIGIMPQVWNAFVGPTASISTSTWLMFACIQFMTMGFAIKVKHPGMFWAMLLSVLESLAIVVASLVLV